LDKETKPWGRALSFKDIQPPYWDREGTFWTNWREPDMDNQITAICILKEYQNESTGRRSGLRLM
jgi:hypothetical protein